MSLLLLSVCFFLLSTVSIRALVILIIGALNSQSNNYKIYTISESGSDAWFVSLDCDFCLFVCFVIFFFLRKPDVI